MQPICLQHFCEIKCWPNFGPSHRHLLGSLAMEGFHYLKVGLVFTKDAEVMWEGWLG